MKKILYTFLLTACFFSTALAKDSIQIKGSDTLINMVQKLAEVYMDKHDSASISVTGGGSGTGIAALLNNNTDIANASRKIKSKEIKKAKKKNIDVKELTIAIDALSVILHPSNLVKSLTVEQIGKIFKGEIRNWKDVGGKNQAISLYGRQSNSGTFSFFRKKVLKAEYSNKMNRMNGNSQIVEAVKHDTSGIGYVGVGYVVKNGKPVSGINILAVANKKGDTAYLPYDAKAVGEGKYPIARGLNQYVNGKPQGLTKKFIEFELSKEGQNIVKKMGFYPIGGDIVKNNNKALKTKIKFF